MPELADLSGTDRRPDSASRVGHQGFLQIAGASVASSSPNFPPAPRPRFHSGPEVFSCAFDHRGHARGKGLSTTYVGHSTDGVHLRVRITSGCFVNNSFLPHELFNYVIVRLSSPRMGRATLGEV